MVYFANAFGRKILQVRRLEHFGREKIHGQQVQERSCCKSGVMETLQTALANLFNTPISVGAFSCGSGISNFGHVPG